MKDILRCGNASIKAHSIPRNAQIGAGMFSLSAGTGILPARPENRVTGEALVQPALSTRSVVERERAGAVAETPERIVASMSKDKIKQSQGAVSPDENEQPLDLILLYEKYKRPIHTYVYRLLGSLEDADDLTQEVFILAFVPWNDLYHPQHLSPYLYPFPPTPSLHPRL